MAKSRGTSASRLFSGSSTTTMNTPEGLCLDTSAAGSGMVLEADQNDFPHLSALLSEPPPTPTKADLSLNAFAEGTSFIIGLSDGEDENEDENEDEDAGSDDSAKTLVSPFADPEDPYDDEAEPGDMVSYWSFSSSSSSSSSSSADSDSSSELAELDFQYDKDPVQILCTDPNGFTSFPSLPSYPDTDEMIFREELLEADKDEAQELIRAVEEVEIEYAGTWARPLPRWAWLSSSNSFPLYNLGPSDLRHGHSKLRQACSVMDGADTDGRDSTRSSHSKTTQELAMVGMGFVEM